MLSVPDRTLVLVVDDRELPAKYTSKDMAPSRHSRDTARQRRTGVLVFTNVHVERSDATSVTLKADDMAAGSSVSLKLSNEPRVDWKHEGLRAIHAVEIEVGNIVHREPFATYYMYVPDTRPSTTLRPSLHRAHFV